MPAVALARAGAHGEDGMAVAAAVGVGVLGVVVGAGGDFFLNWYKFDSPLND